MLVLKCICLTIGCGLGEERCMGVATDAGDLPMCGTGQDGRLGLGDDGGRTRPTLVLRAQCDDDAVLMVACG